MTAEFKRPVDIHRDPRVAQYLGGRRETLISPETAALVAVDESLEAFRARIHDHVVDTKRRKEVGAAIWCITHQIVIEEVADRFSVKIPGDLNFLAHVVMLS